MPNPSQFCIEPEPESDRVRFNLLRQGKIEQFILLNMGEKIFGSNGQGLGRRVALDGNLLLVGYASEDSTGGAYLFGLARLRSRYHLVVNHNYFVAASKSFRQYFLFYSVKNINFYKQ